MNAHPDDTPSASFDAPLANRKDHANKLANTLASVDTSSRLAHWLNAFAADEQSFASKAVFVEMRLRQALASSVAMGIPNVFRTAVVFDAFERVAPLTGRYEGVLGVIWREIVRITFVDYTHDLPGSGARAYAERTPYFKEAARQKAVNEELKEEAVRQEEKKVAEAKAAENRSGILGKALGRFNQVLGAHAGMSEAALNRLKAEEMEKALAEAEETIKQLQGVDPVSKLIELFGTMTDDQREEVLTVHLFETEAIAMCMRDRETPEVAHWISHFLSAIPDDAESGGSRSATRGKVLAYLQDAMDDNEKILYAASCLGESFDSQFIGEALASVLLNHARTYRHKETIVAMNTKLNAFTNDPDYEPPLDDPNSDRPVAVLQVLHNVFATEVAEAPAGEEAQMMDPRAAAAEAAAVRNRVAELKRKKEAGELSAEEARELEQAETKLASLEKVIASGEAGEDEDAVRDRIAELKRKQEAGELSDEEMKELEHAQAKLKKLEEKAASQGDKPIPSDPEAAEAEAAALRDRVAELKRKQEAGELTEAEKRELEKAEARLDKFEGAQKSRDRIKELEEKKKKGKLTKAEKEELAREKKRLAALEGGGTGSKDDAERDALFAKRLAELERRHAMEIEEEQRRMNALMEKLMDPNLSEEEKRALIGAEMDRQAEAASKRKAKLEALSGRKQVSKAEADAAEKEAKAVRDRVKELKRKKAAGELSEEEMRELEAAEAKLKALEDTIAAHKKGGAGKSSKGGNISDGGGAFFNALGIEVKDSGAQAGVSMLGRGGASFGNGPRSNKLPDSAMTSLGEIKFGKKNVNDLNVLMCRKLAAALLQMKAQLNATEIGKQRQGFADFVPEQLVVLYGIKSVAFTKMQEFFYGVRAGRFRTNAKGESEDEPLLYFFWTACHHGVPMDERLPPEDLDLYVALLAMTAKCVGDEHTLNVKEGAFWNMIGTMAEPEIPLFVLLKTLEKLYGPDPMHGKEYPGEPQILERAKKLTTSRASSYLTQSKSRRANKPCPSYKPILLGADKNVLDARGHLPLQTFLELGIQAVQDQRKKDAKVLDNIFETWKTNEDEPASFDDFADMFEYANDEVLVAVAPSP